MADHRGLQKAHALLGLLCSTNGDHVQENSFPFCSVITMKTPKAYIAVLLLDQILIQKSQVNNT